jgi:hypothetical protein
MSVITESYREQNRWLIENNPKYAISGHNNRDQVRPIADYGRKEILDYGCGRKLLAFALGPAYSVFNYDPAVPDCADTPAPREVVYCGDVLEHIEPDCLDDVLADLRRCVIGIGLFRIAIVPSNTSLPDGRNAHLLVHPHEWWKQKLIEAGFKIMDEKPKEEIVGMTWFEVA